MAKEMEFFIYLIENYAEHKGTTADKIMRLWDERGITDFIYNMYEMYHSERIENAFADIDSLLATGKTAW